jgi:quercetin dioxygenase-like cupin family protein
LSFYIWNFIISRQARKSLCKRKTYIQLKINENYFTGNIIISEILGEDNSAEQEMYHVTFQNGALTTLHFHGSDQILIATNGKTLFL